MSWATVPLVVEQNSQFSDSWYFFTQTDQFGSPSDWVAYNFTGTSLKMEVRAQQDAGSTLLATFGTGTGEIVYVAGTVTPGPAVPGFNNGFTLTVAAATSLGIAAGIYFYDLFLTSAGVPLCIFNGTFEVVATVTR